MPSHGTGQEALQAQAPGAPLHPLLRVLEHLPAHLWPPYDHLCMCDSLAGALLAGWLQKAQVPVCMVSSRPHGSAKVGPQAKLISCAGLGLLDFWPEEPLRHEIPRVTMQFVPLSRQTLATSA